MVKKKWLISFICVMFLVLIALSNSALAASSNANLKNLGFTPNDFKGFRASKTEYDVNVPEEVSDIDVYAEAQDENATIEGVGSYELSPGLNKILIIVTAEDGTKKEYTINITKPESSQTGLIQNQTDENSGKETEVSQTVEENKEKVKEEPQKSKDTLDATQKMYIVIGLVVTISLIGILCAISAYRNRYVEDDDYEEYDYEEALNRFKPLPSEDRNPIEEIYHRKEGRKEELKKIDLKEDLQKERIENNLESKESPITKVEIPSKKDVMLNEFMNEKEGRTKERRKGKHF